jgi:hypothetical protein
MAQACEAVRERKLMLEFAHRAGHVEKDHLPALRANEMLVMPHRVRELVIRARALEIHLVHRAEALEQNHHAKHSRVVRQLPALGLRPSLNFLEGKRLGSFEQSEHDPSTTARDAQPAAAEQCQNTFNSEIVTRSLHQNVGACQK